MWFELLLLVSWTRSGSTAASHPVSLWPEPCVYRKMGVVGVRAETLRLLPRLQYPALLIAYLKPRKEDISWAGMVTAVSTRALCC